MAVAERFFVLGILLLQLFVHTIFTNPTCICNGNNNRNNPNPTITLRNVGTNQAQTFLQQNLGPAIANQLQFKEVNVQNIGQSTAQNNIECLTSAQQQQNDLQSLTQKLLNSAPISISTGNLATTRPTITLLDPATTAAFQSFLSPKSGTNVDQPVNLPGQTRLPLSSLPVSFINKFQNTPDILPVQQQGGFSNLPSNFAPAQNSLTPLQGQISLESLLNVLSNLQNDQSTSVVQNAVPTFLKSPVPTQEQNLVIDQNTVPAIFSNPIPNQQQNLMTNQNAMPAVHSSPVPNQQQNQLTNQNPAIFSSSIPNQSQNLVANQKGMPAVFNSHVPNPQQNQGSNQNVFNSPTVPRQQQNLVAPPAPNSCTGQSYASVPQNQPQPLGQSQPALSTMMLYPQGHTPSQQYTPPPLHQPIENPIQTGNSNLKKLLPLLFDLVKENECGCQSCTCPCHNNNHKDCDNNNYAMQPHVNSGYAKQINYGYTDKSEMGEKENEVFESLGSLRDRLKLWKTKNNSSADSEETEQKCETEEN